ncbi:hypothetical protein B0T19DRAFT_285601 [Cercophora scortea]|uniref:Uncharacterized protein n=1 Tax=Cercophora scortea TaxID=314031 RepID=A0AAE0M724_9PEZI|nr:hypothetical protein B0T19DRAFT_285601 [Cercophora scortea]
MMRFDNTIITHERDESSDDAATVPLHVDSMSDFKHIDLGPEDEDLEQASMTIVLGKSGELDSSYRLRNDPSAPFQRQGVVDRRGVVEVQCQSREIIHGALSPDADEFATLLVYDVRFDSTRRSRRITSATVKFEFSSSVSVARVLQPLVHSIAPDGRVALLPSTQEESVTRGAEISTGALAEMIASVGASVKWEKTVIRTTNDDARVIGSPVWDEYGKQVGAKFVLNENRSIKSGVPSLLRCVLLLSRPDESLFQCKVTIKAETDWKSEIGSKLFGDSTDRDDPVLFDPAMAPTNKLRKAGYDMDNLGSVDLKSLQEIRF